MIVTDKPLRSMKRDSFLINEEDLNDNEFFRLRKVFREISSDDKKTDLYKLQLLLEKAESLYLYLRESERKTKKIFANRFPNNRTEPVKDWIPEEEIIQEAEHCFQKRDFKHGIENLTLWKDSYKNQLAHLKVYEPFFDYILELSQKILLKMQHLEEQEQLLEQLNDVRNELQEAKKRNTELASDINRLEQQSKEDMDFFVEKAHNIFINLDKHEMFQLLLKKKENLTPEKAKALIKLFTYLAHSNIDEAEEKELRDLILSGEEIELIKEEPEIQYADKKIKLLLPNLKTPSHSLWKKINDRITKRTV